MSRESAHVAVDARLARAGGHGTYLTNIVPRLSLLAPQWRWSLLGDADYLHSESWTQGSNVDVVECRAPVYGVREQLEIPLRVPRGADIFWAPHYNAPLALPLPLVATIHDAAHLRLPEYRERAVRYAYARFMFHATAAKAKAIVCNSEFTRREVEAFVSDSSSKTTVVHMGIDEAWYAPVAIPSPVPRKYFVFIGNLKPHKNLGTLLRALELVKERIPERLVVVGNYDGLRTPDEMVMKELDALSKRVTLMGKVPDESLRALVHGATALVMPSRYEGFGFPPLEAMATGCPALVSRSASLPEVCGDAALYFDASDPGELADALERVSTDAALRRDLTNRGLTQARRFSWDTCARKTLDVLQSVVTKS